MRTNREYLIYRSIASYLCYVYPDVMFRFDMAGLNLSKAQAGMNKAIQKLKGWPDLMILESRGGYYGLFIEIKPEGTDLYKRDGTPKTPHIAEQMECADKLRRKGYKAMFAVGFDEAQVIIDSYLTGK